MSDEPIDVKRARAAMRAMDKLADKIGLKVSEYTDADIDELEHQLEEAMADNDARIGLRLSPELV